jgi:hypothetical protein
MLKRTVNTLLTRPRGRYENLPEAVRKKMSPADYRAMRAEKRQATTQSPATKAQP